MIIQPLVLCGAPRPVCPALTLAAVHAVTADDPVLLAMPSEYSVARPEPFARALERGAALAQAGYVVCFGIAPSAPDTGHGLIRMGNPLPGESEACGVDALVETAAPSLGVLWNSGIFMVRASVWIEAVGLAARDILAWCERAYREGRQDAGLWRLDQLRSEPLKYALLEAIVALGAAPAGGGPETVAVRLETGGAGMRAWDLVRPCDAYVLAEHRLVARVGEAEAVLVEIPSYDDVRAAA
jgi:mannose-1-phosphate guanylyltransferase / mannose-6-phosphate isomerase